MSCHDLSPRKPAIFGAQCGDLISMQGLRTLRKEKKMDTAHLKNSAKQVIEQPVHQIETVN